MRNLSLSKKGQVNLLAPAILALVFAGVVLVFGIVMSQELQNTQAGTETITVTNQSVSQPGAANATIRTASATCGFTTWNSSVRVFNYTTGAQGAVGNQTLVEGTHYRVWSDSSKAYLENLTATWNASKVTYTYSWGGQACESANLTTHGLGAFADFWEIIVLAIVITVVIGLLLVIFGGRGKNR